MGFKWARNNSLQLFTAAQAEGVLDWRPEGVGQHDVLYQFQCLVTTTDTYYRRIKGHSDRRFGILLSGDGAVGKREIAASDIGNILHEQLQVLELLLRTYSIRDFEAKVRDIQAIANHEYLHQGQMVVMFRQAGVALPERFRAAFDL